MTLEELKNELNSDIVTKSYSWDNLSDSEIDNLYQNAKFELNLIDINEESVEFGLYLKLVARFCYYYQTLDVEALNQKEKIKSQKLGDIQVEFDVDNDSQKDSSYPIYISSLIDFATSSNNTIYGCVER